MASRSICSSSVCCTRLSAIAGFAADYTLTLAFPPVALVMGDFHQPLRQCTRLAQFWKASKQFQASCLKDVGRVGSCHAVLYWNRIDQSLVLINEQRPCLLAPSQTDRKST